MSAHGPNVQRALLRSQRNQESAGGALVDGIALLLVLAIYGMAAALVLWGAR